MSEKVERIEEEKEREQAWVQLFCEFIGKAAAKQKDSAKQRLQEWRIRELQEPIGDRLVLEAQAKELVAKKPVTTLIDSTDTFVSALRR